MKRFKIVLVLGLILLLSSGEVQVSRVKIDDLIEYKF
jgi:hypothetical protein